MADVATVVEEQIKEPAQRPGEIIIDPTKLVGSMWGIQEEKKPEEEKPIITEQPKVETTPASTEQPKKEEEEIIEEDESYKREFGKTKQELKAEYEELKKFRETKPVQEEYKFENEESKRLAEAIAKGDRKTVLQILEKQDKIETYLTGEVNNNNAESIIKLGMKLKYADLSDAEINYKYNKQYSVPKEPVRLDTDTDEDYEAKKSGWQEQVKDVEMSKLIDAKLVRPELEQAKTKLVLPEIQRPEQPVQKQLTQEELDAVKKYEDAYMQSVDSSIKNFNGISVAVKNEVVDFPVLYGAPEEDKKAIAEMLKDFAKGNYDTNPLFAKLWVNEDGTLKTDQMIEDYYLIKNKKSILSKVVNDTSAKTLELYLKGKKNIDVNATSQPGTAQINKDDKTELDLVRDQFFG